MKIKIRMITAAALLLAVCSTHAVTYTDTDSFGLFGTKVNGQTPLEGFFQIDLDDADGINDDTGFASGDTVNWAKASFLLGDDLDFQSESVDISLGGAVFKDGASVPWLVGWVAGSITGTALFDLQADGTLKYVISADRGDFRAYAAILEADVTKGSTNVPDSGSAVALLGAVIAGLGLVRRRLVV